jgi:hypothetical protein
MTEEFNLSKKRINQKCPTCGKGTLGIVILEKDVKEFIRRLKERFNELNDKYPTMFPAMTCNEEIDTLAGEGLSK